MKTVSYTAEPEHLANCKQNVLLTLFSVWRHQATRAHFRQKEWSQFSPAAGTLARLEQRRKKKHSHTLVLVLTWLTRKDNKRDLFPLKCNVRVVSIWNYFEKLTLQTMLKIYHPNVNLTNLSLLTEYIFQLRENWNTPHLWVVPAWPELDGKLWSSKPNGKLRQPSV